MGRNKEKLKNDHGVRKGDLLIAITLVVLSLHE